MPHEGVPVDDVDRRSDAQVRAAQTVLDELEAQHGLRDVRQEVSRQVSTEVNGGESDPATRSLGHVTGYLGANQE